MNNIKILTDTLTIDYLENTIYQLEFKLQVNLDNYDDASSKLHQLKLLGNNVNLPKMPLYVKKPKRDMIYDNDYNYGTLNLKFNQELKVDYQYEQQYMNDVRNPEDVNLHKVVMDDCLIILNTFNIDWNDKNKKNWLQTYNRLVDMLSNKIYSQYLIFGCFCDILHIKRKIFWKVISTNQQYIILEELQDIVGNVELYNNDCNLF